MSLTNCHTSDICSNQIFNKYSMYSTAFNKLSFSKGIVIVSPNPISPDILSDRSGKNPYFCRQFVLRSSKKHTRTPTRS